MKSGQTNSYCNGCRCTTRHTVRVGSSQECHRCGTIKYPVAKKDKQAA